MKNATVWLLGFVALATSSAHGESLNADLPFDTYFKRVTRALETQDFNLLQGKDPQGDTTQIEPETIDDFPPPGFKIPEDFLR